MNKEHGDDVAVRRAAVVAKMVAGLRRGGSREYALALVGYFIEGIPYSASGLSINPDATPDVFQEEDALISTAFFPPDQLQPSTVKKHRLVEKVFGGEVQRVVKVKVEVKLHDIWQIVEFVDGEQHDLFFDPRTFVTRKQRFAVEMHQWFATRNANK
jgi:hypothetical protein